jgi:hypothetical protein
MYVSMVNTFDQGMSRFELGVARLSTSWIPKKPWIWAFAGLAGSYGKRLGETYAAGYISGFFINRTIIFMGSETMGRITGITIVAPMFTPDLVPWGISLSAFVMFYFAVLIGNLVDKILSYRSSKSAQPPTPPDNLPLTKSLPKT